MRFSKGICSDCGGDGEHAGINGRTGSREQKPTGAVIKNAPAFKMLRCGSGIYPTRLLSIEAVGFEYFTEVSLCEPKQEVSILSIEVGSSLPLNRGFCDLGGAGGGSILSIEAGGFEFYSPVGFLSACSPCFNPLHRGGGIRILSSASKIVAGHPFQSSPSRRGDSNMMQR